LVDPMAVAMALSLFWTPSGKPDAVRIFAAVSLTDSLEEILDLFEAAHPEVYVVPQLGASNDLARQILAGAEAHLFLSADRAQMDRVEGSIAAGSRRDLLSNRLAVVVARTATAAIRGPRDLERAVRIALADPQAVPAGVYARQYLEKLGLWDRLSSRVVPTFDARAALAAVASGNVDAGIVYETDARMEPRVRVAFAVPKEEGPAIVYHLALMRGANEDARALYLFLLSPGAKAVFERRGFVVLGGEK